MTLHTDTARLIIRKTAEANGWTRHVDRSIPADRELYRRGDAAINVRFGVRGAVAFAERRGGGLSDITGLRGKRETVIGWLTEAPAAEVRAANRAAADADCHAAELDDEAATDDQRDRDAAMAELAEDAGTYPTLDAAEHGQPLASLDRLAKLAGRYASRHEAALVRDHASAVRARIAELERERSTYRQNAERNARTIVELEAECDTALPARRIGAETAPTTYGDALAELERAWARIAELERSNSVLVDAAVREQDRARAGQDRIVELEREVERLAGVDMAAAEGNARIVELERIATANTAAILAVGEQRDALFARVRELEHQAEVKDQDYRKVRERVVELEDSIGPMRRTTLELRAQLAAVERGYECPECHDTNPHHCLTCIAAGRG